MVIKKIHSSLDWLRSKRQQYSLIPRNTFEEGSSYCCNKILKDITERAIPAFTHSQGGCLVSICLVVNDDQKWLKALLPSLLNYTRNVNYELVIVDNCSQDESVAILETYSNSVSINIIGNKKKISFSCAHNDAVRKAVGKYIVTLKSGTLPLNGWLNHLVFSAESQTSIGLVGGRVITRCNYIHSLMRKLINHNQNCMSQTGIVFSDETTRFRPHYLFNKLELSEDEPVESIDRCMVMSSCFLILRRTYLDVGGFDERFTEYGESIDLGLKLYNMGYINKYSVNSVLTRSKPAFWEKQYSNKALTDFSKLQDKWYNTLKKSYWGEKIYGRLPLLSETPLKIAIAVTDHGEGVTAGDYFTAQELSHAMKPYGWEVIYLSRKKGEWYNFPEDVDVMLNLLDAYNLDKIPLRKKRLVTIAWARNWFDKWCEMSCFNDYDIVFSSSQKSCQYINDNSRQIARLLPIASNAERFRETPECSGHSSYKSDVCFTGSYWDYPRDIVDGVSQKVLDKYNFSIYGANWEKVDKFAKYSKGFIDYAEIPCVYHQTKIVIDDANHVTKPYGSVNSRVFDAIMSGALVITNGMEGSKELFSGELPYYNNQESLTELIDYYLSNEEKRKEKIQRLRDIVSEKHTYKQRSDSFKNALENRFLSHSIAIKIPAPSWEDACNWGDYHLAVSLKQALEKENFRVIIQVLPEWDNEEGYECDSVIVLRGLSRYMIKPHQLNIMWNISHPDKVSLAEYEEYDQVFIASELWAEKISKKVSVPVDTMLQCTNPEIFHEPTHKEKIAYRQQLLFVGNSRKVQRKLLKDLLPTAYDLSVYGKDWEGLVPNTHIKGIHISNDELYKYYGSAEILLNDHWDDMREKGFISNRIFDGLASGALILTDRVTAMGELEGFVRVYDSPTELVDVVQECLTRSEALRDRVLRGREYVLKEHTFKHRAEQFSRYIQSRNNTKLDC